MRGREAVRGAAKMVAVVLIGAAIGLGAGRGIAEVAGDSGPPGAPPETAAPPEPSGGVDEPSRADPVIGVNVTFAGLRPAATPQGRDRDRARLRVGLRVRNRSDRRVTIDPPRIQVGEDTVRVDKGAEDLAEDVFEPLSPGASAKGELRFETTGATTRKLMDRRRTTLRIAGRKIQVRYEVGPTLSETSGESSSEGSEESSSEESSSGEPSSGSTTTIEP
jgi:hypothetical protein